MAGIYIHIPFCRQACHYCDFHFSTSLKNKTSFVDSLVVEIGLRKNFFISNEGDKPANGTGSITSVYLGGGTPSLLQPGEIERILREVNTNFSVVPHAEITLEANPDDLDRIYLEELLECGINRLSIGVQSFHDEDLRYMNRLHDARQAIEVIEQAAAAGFQNISVDLIYGTPTLSERGWKKNLQTVFELPVNHLSCYALTVEPRTALHAMIRKGKATPVEDDRAALHFEILSDACASAGFEQYEISNFCKNGFYSVHNSSYWKNEPYLGLGPSAHSYNGVVRQHNIRNNAIYIRSLNNKQLTAETEILENYQRYNEYVLTSLRTKWGASLKNIEINFGTGSRNHFLQSAAKWLDQELLMEEKPIGARDEVFVLTHKGKLLADKICLDLFLTGEVQ